MAISSVNNNPSILSRILPFKSKDVATPDKNKISSLDGDTLKLSDRTPKVASKTTVYAPPKPVNPLDPTVKTANVAANADLKKIPATAK